MFKTTPQLNLATEAEISQGIALIDKPTGVSSHYVVNHLRKRFKLKRVGHAGTLDPLATGLLICLVGRNFTKLQSHFLKQPKTYQCDFSLGFTTDTYDRLGRKTSEADWEQLKLVSRAQAEQTLTDFVGFQSQVVPAFSAVKIHGEKLYKKALNDPSFNLASLPSRTVNITELSLLNWKIDSKAQTVSGTLKVACSSGTYVRSLVHDFGQKLGVGGCVTELRRHSIGVWDVKTAAKISDDNVPLYQDISDLPLQ